MNFNSSEIRVEQACYRGVIGSPKTKGSRRMLPMPEALRTQLMRLDEQSVRQSEEQLVFRSRNGTPFSDTNLLHKQLKPAGRKLGMPWLNWHTLRRTHATLFQVAGGFFPRKLLSRPTPPVLWPERKYNNTLLPRKLKNCPV